MSIRYADDFDLEDQHKVGLHIWHVDCLLCPDECDDGNVVYFADIEATS